MKPITIYSLNLSHTLTITRLGTWLLIIQSFTFLPLGSSIKRVPHKCFHMWVVVKALRNFQSIWSCCRLLTLQFFIILYNTSLALYHTLLLHVNCFNCLIIYFYIHAQNILPLIFQKIFYSKHLLDVSNIGRIIKDSLFYFKLFIKYFIYNNSLSKSNKIRTIYSAVFVCVLMFTNMNSCCAHL